MGETGTIGHGVPAFLSGGKFPRTTECSQTGLSFEPTIPPRFLRCVMLAPQIAGAGGPRF